MAIDHGAGTNGGANPILQEAEFDSNKVLEEHFKWNGLHKATFKGDTQFVQKLVQPLDSQHPSRGSSLHYLSEIRDSHQRSPLHLASAYGHVEIVKLLVKANPIMCLAYDKDGLNPLHAAAVTGKVEVLDALFEANPCAARARVDNRERETILHLCVKYDQLNFLKKLLEKHFKWDKEFLNAKDLDGNTLLHLAVASKRVKIIKFVLGCSGIEVNETNASKQTALDILLLTKCEGTEPLPQSEETEPPTQSEGTEPEHVDIEDLLRQKKAKSGSKLDLTKFEFIEKKRKWLTIVAILMATIAFQAGVNPPGGVWLDTSDVHQAGHAVMAYTNPHSYSLFICCNTIGFVASLLTITFLITGAYKKQISVGALVAVMFVSITATAFTYAYAVIVFTPKRERKLVDYTVAVAVIVWFGTQAMFVILHGMHLVEKFLQKKIDKGGEAGVWMMKYRRPYFRLTGKIMKYLRPSEPSGGQAPSSNQVALEPV